MKPPVRVVLKCMGLSLRLCKLNLLSILMIIRGQLEERVWPTQLKLRNVWVIHWAVKYTFIGPGAVFNRVIVVIDIEIQANISTSRHVMGVHNNSVGHKPDCRPPTFELLRKPRGVYVFLVRELCNWCNRLANFCYCNNIDINETMFPSPLSPSSDIWVAEETSAMSLSLWYMSFAWQIGIRRNP